MLILFIVFLFLLYVCKKRNITENFLPDKNSICLFYINVQPLPQMTDKKRAQNHFREANILKQCKKFKMNCKRIDAITPYSFFDEISHVLPQSNCNISGISEGEYQIRNGVPELGTHSLTLSWIKALQTFVDSDYDYGIISEDDVEFEDETPDYLPNIVEDLNRNNPKWDGIHLCSHNKSKHLAYNKDKPRYGSAVFKWPGNPGCLLVNKTGGKKIKEAMIKHICTNKHIPPSDVTHYRIYSNKDDFDLMVFFSNNPQLCRNAKGAGNLTYSY